jgi:hypothetical protein
MIIKYTNNNGQLNEPCPHKKQVSHDLKTTIMVGSVFCMRCPSYVESKAKYSMVCKCK